MDDQNRNLILATALSFLVILVWFLLFPPEEQAPNPNPTAPSEQQLDAGDIAALPPTAGDQAPPTGRPHPMRPTEAQRIPIDTPALLRLDLATRRSDRRPFAQALPRGHRPRLADRATAAARRRRSRLLRDLRLGRLARRLGRRRRARPQHRLAARVGRNARARLTGHAGLGEPGRPDLPARDLGRRKLPLHRHPERREHVRGTGPPRALWHRRTAWRARRPEPLLHHPRRPDPDGGRPALRDGLRRRRRPRCRRTRGRARRGCGGRRERLDRLHRPLLDDRSRPRAGAAVHRRDASTPRTPTSTRPRRGCPQSTVAPGATATLDTATLCRRQGMGDDPRVPAGRHRQVHRRDRLGLVLLPDQADLRRAALAERPDRQHGRRRSSC